MRNKDHALQYQSDTSGFVDIRFLQGIDTADRLRKKKRECAYVVYIVDENV